jgi:SAM-dependent methyltransferase
MPRSNQPIHSTEYSEEYFLAECDGCVEYRESGGRLLTPRLRALWSFGDVRSEMKVLDLGCGRGEVIVRCGLEGARAIGIDYSQAGLHLAQQTIARADTQDVDTWKRPDLSLGDVKHLPFSENVFDRIIMSDIVEHLYPDELEKTLREVYRVLVPGGTLLVHTMPNLWYYRFGYPLFRLVQRLRGVSLPTNPRERFKFSHVHVNEQTPCALHRTLARIGFSNWRVWLYDYHDYVQYGRVMRRLMGTLTGLPVVKQMFCDDIFALARK